MSLTRMMQDRFSRRRRPRTIIWIAAVLLLASAIGGYFRTAQHLEVPKPLGGEAVFSDISESAFGSGIVRETHLTLSGEREFAIKIYDFDSLASYFPGEEDLIAEQQLQGVPRDEEFVESWVVVFAGASFEGVPAKNFELCRCRAWIAAGYLSNEDAPVSRGYWSIPAGEFTMPDGSPHDSSGDEAAIEAEEEEEAKRLGEAGLRSQRRLLIVTVRPLQEAPSDSAQAQVNEVAWALGERGLLPTNYDKATARPVALDPSDDKNPCHSEAKSVTRKIEKLLERLFSN